MAKTIIFKPEFEQKLKELKVKTKFVNNLKAYCKQCHYCLATKIAALNNKDTFSRFIGEGFIWADTPEGHAVWNDIEKL